MSNYDFQTLSPIDFEELVRDLLQAEFGLLFESFGPGPDLGIDFRFAIGKGRAVVQAKHYIGSGFDALVAAAKRENLKIKRLKPTHYLLVTSLSLSPVRKAKLKAALRSTAVTLNDIYGREDLNNLLGRHPNVERKNFKLWLASTAVFDRIVHSGVYNRTQAEMSVIRAIVPKFVQNDSVPKAHAILDKKGALIIAGEPGVGKSTLARMLIWMHAQQGWNVSVIDDIADAFTIPHEGEKRLVFFDDFLGQIRLTSDLIRSVDQRLPPFLQRVKSTKSLRFIMTTRDYVLHQAQEQSERLSGPTLRPSEFTLNVGYYTRTVKARMLFNHIFFSDLAASDRRALLDGDFFLNIIKHRNFNPRIVSLVTSADYISLVDGPIRGAVTTILDNPHILWEKPYRNHITEDGQALMLALFFSPQWVPTEALERSFGRHSMALGRPVAQAALSARFKIALRELEGSVLAIQNRTVAFSNPGVQDFLHRVVVEDNVLPSIVGIVEEFVEFKQAWEIWCEQKRTAIAMSSMSAVWTAAASRLLDTSAASPLELLSLLIGVYDRLRTDEVAILVDRGIDGLEATTIDADEADKASYLLEQLIATLLPFGVMDKAKTVVTAAVAMMLEEYGYALSLDTIKSVSKSLSQYGSDKAASAKASSEALKGYLGQIDSTLSEIRSLDELDAFETELHTAMKAYGVKIATVEYEIESRREALVEQPERASSTGSGWSPPQVPGDMSDNDIRSLFQSLRDD